MNFFGSKTSEICNILKLKDYLFISPFHLQNASCIEPQKNALGGQLLTKLFDYTDIAVTLTSSAIIGRLASARHPQPN